MNLKQFKQDWNQFRQDFAFIIGLTWYNFTSEKPDIGMITNGLGDDKFIPVGAAPKPEDILGDNYTWDSNKKEWVMKEKILPKYVQVDRKDLYNSRRMLDTEVFYHTIDSRYPLESQRMMERNKNLSPGYMPRSGNNSPKGAA